MITERTLRMWRKEALMLTKKIRAYPRPLIDLDRDLLNSQERILRMTQELLDQHLLRRK